MTTFNNDKLEKEGYTAQEQDTESNTKVMGQFQSSGAKGHLASLKL
jgi:hypothetical protein